MVEKTVSPSQIILASLDNPREATEIVESPSRLAWRRFRRHRVAVLGAFLLLLITGLVVFAPWVTSYEPNELDISNRLQSPTLTHLMGTDELGRDVFTRVLYGGRISLTIGVAAMVISVTIGTFIGAVSGYMGGRVDGIIMRFVDVIISFPSLFLLIMLSSFLGSTPSTMILVIGILSWMRVSRLVRANFIAIKGREYVTAAYALGASGKHIVLRHLLPNSLGPITIAATISVSFAILTESALSYLGLGVQPPQATWGNMLRFAQDQMSTAPWTAIFPGLMIFFVSIAINFIGDGMRDAFDPHAR
jgi:peptide/nickel transport system permease protein